MGMCVCVCVVGWVGLGVEETGGFKGLCAEGFRGIGAEVLGLAAVWKGRLCVACAAL